MANILVGVSSSIACYKSLALIKKLQQKGHRVKAILTKNVLHLVPKSAFEQLCEVYVETFQQGMDYRDYLKQDISHISLADWADLVVLAPATANVIGKLAHGIADDLLTTTLLATKAEVMICPAMNCNMYEHSMVQENLKKLKKHGYVFIGPGYGKLACNWEGHGRLEDLEVIVEHIQLHFSKQLLKGKNILITAGPTEESIDPVRVITNKSSGKFGYALAQAARQLGANVTLITGRTMLPRPAVKKTIHILTAEELRKAVMKEYKDKDIIIMAAAVADFRAEHAESRKKIKKEYMRLIKLVKNPDILAELGKKKKTRQLLIGFALETENLVSNARKKLKEKRCDMMVANTPKNLGSDKGEVLLLTRKKTKHIKGSKAFMARKLLEAIA